MQPNCYPDEFSNAARNRVEAVLLRERRTLNKIWDGKAEPPARRNTPYLFGPRWSEEEEDFHNYLVRGLLAFAQEVCALGRQGEFALDTARELCEQFLESLAHNAFYDFGRPRVGDPFEHNTMGSSRLLREVLDELGRTAEWQEYEGQLLRAAESSQSSRGLCDELKKLRSEANWTQEKLADKANVSVETVQNIESGKTIPAISTLNKLSAALTKELNRPVRLSNQDRRAR